MMRRVPVLLLAVAGLGAVIGVLNPFAVVGADWWPGLADLVNGITALGLMVIGAIWAVMAAKRGKA